MTDDDSGTDRTDYLRVPARFAAYPKRADGDGGAAKAATHRGGDGRW